MKKFKVAFHTMHESYNGYDHSDGWRDHYAGRFQLWSCGRQGAIQRTLICIA